MFRMRCHIKTLLMVQVVGRVFMRLINLMILNNFACITAMTEQGGKPLLKAVAREAWRVTQRLGLCSLIAVANPSCYLLAVQFRHCMVITP